MQKEKWGKDDKGKIWSGETLTQRKKKERNEHLLEKDNQKRQEEKRREQNDIEPIKYKGRSREKEKLNRDK